MIEVRELPDAFADYAVEVTGPTAADRLACRLREHGLATFGGVSDRGAATRLAQQVMDVWPHRDSEPDSVTVVADRGDLSRTPGMAGFGHDGLDLHTESSTVAYPPQLMMLACVTAASEGGACVLADGHLVYQRVSEQQPELLELLCAPRSVLFGGASGHLASVFGAGEDGRVTV
ncbi:MAG TPA: hypothetical protein DGG94_06870, partial [Micromonosporaceae bacterium]|nr:hypothetical protein [Micromonosporaceae bacterium]